MHPYCRVYSMFPTARKERCLTSKLIFMQRSLAVGAILANREAVLHKSVTCGARFRYLLAEVNLGTGT
jgi:hypothetical protein